VELTQDNISTTLGPWDTGRLEPWDPGRLEPWDTGCIIGQEQGWFLSHKGVSK